MSPARIVNRARAVVLADIAIGIVGAIVGGFIFERFGDAGVTGFNVWSILVATTGAIVLLFVVNLFRRSE